MQTICCKVVKVANKIYVAHFERIGNNMLHHTLEGFSKVAKIMLHAHTHYYAAALGGKVTVLQSLVITPTLHLKSKIDKNTGPV